MAMNWFRSFLVAAALLFAATGPALATNCGTGSGTCFVIGGGGNWSANTTWTDSSGGAPCTCTPAAGDAVIIDSASGNSAINSGFTAAIASLDASGTGGSGSPFTGTLTHNTGVTLTVSGNLYRLSLGMTYTKGSSTTSATSFTSTSGTALITTSGKILGNTTFGTGGVTGGTYQLQDAFAANGAAGTVVTIAGGTLNTNGQTLAVSNLTTNSGTATRQLTLGATTVNIGAQSGTAVDFSGTGATISAASATVALPAPNTVSAALTANFGTSNTIGTVTIAAASGGQTALTATTGLTINTLTVSAGAVLRFPTPTTTITNAFTPAGTSSAPIYLSGVSNTAVSTVNVAASSSISWATLYNLTFASNPITASNSFGFNTSGVTVNGPSAGGGSRIIGG